MSVASSAASVSLPKRKARASGFLRICSIQSSLADDDAALRAADELVAAEADDIGAGRDALLDQRLVLEAVLREVDQRAAAEVVDHRDAVLAAELGQLLDARLLGEADDAVVAVVDAQDGAGVLGRWRAS